MAKARQRGAGDVLSLLSVACVMHVMSFLHDRNA